MVSTRWLHTYQWAEIGIYFWESSTFPGTTINAPNTGTGAYPLSISGYANTGPARHGAGCSSEGRSSCVVDWMGCVCDDQSQIYGMRHITAFYRTITDMVNCAMAYCPPSQRPRSASAKGGRCECRGVSLSAGASADPERGFH